VTHDRERKRTSQQPDYLVNLAEELHHLIVFFGASFYDAVRLVLRQDIVASLRMAFQHEINASRFQRLHERPDVPHEVEDNGRRAARPAASGSMQKIHAVAQNHVRL
jgi:hypothetical protein